MLHEIEPLYLDNSFEYIKPEDGDFCICFSYGNIMVGDGDSARFPVYEELKFLIDRSVYLFSIGGHKYFLCQLREDDVVGYQFVTIKRFMSLKPKAVVYAGMTAYHLAVWYRDTKFCGRCGHPLVHDHKERMMYCENCKNAIYPKIMPAVIVGVIHDDKILVTKYRDREREKSGYALIAGFTEIGETAEETVAREVMEETGVKVKNIKYFGTQPWGVAQDLLLGFFCELDGEPKIKMDDQELSYASFVSRDELEVEDHDVSMTNRMLYLFANGQV